MSSEAQVAQLQELLARVQGNRLRLAELRTRAAEAPAIEPEPIVEAVAAPAEKEPAAVLQPVEPEPELEPLPDEPMLVTPSEPFEEVVATRPFPLVAEAPARKPDLTPQRFQGAVAATGPIAEFTGAREIQRSFALDAVLFRAWRLGRDGGSR